MANTPKYTAVTVRSVFMDSKGIERAHQDRTFHNCTEAVAVCRARTAAQRSSAWIGAAGARFEVISYKA